MKSQAATEKLQTFIKQFKISLVVVQEPFVKEEKIDFYKQKLGMQECFVNTSNKIWIFWSSEVKCDMFANDAQMLTCKVCVNPADSGTFVSFVYAKTRSAGRIHLWEHIRAFSSSMVCGDFNCILDPNEKIGGVPHKLSKSLEIIECLADCGLSDMGYNGSLYTWCNERKEKEIIWKRVDRMVANDELGAKFTSISVQHLARVSSDHCPLFITLKDYPSNTIRYFKFLNFWVEQEGF
ncbi:uncharacterized protein LOC132613367 [Lycium barbarum]|uniref:uncharacterized protein LOC132613367 n=1 Tax=Lycium barbarum TaxID=112863 RepID=UPI00293E9E36|nr:uncharacterized protein LOC132613367 [Lycium barbarum]